MQLSTVNVIELEDNIITGIASYSDDSEGNIEAENSFRGCAKLMGATDQDLENYAIEDRMWHRGNYRIFLTRAHN